MDWKTCATDASPIVQPCRVWQHLGKSDLGQRRLRPRAREAEGFFSRRPCPCDHSAGTNTPEQKARFWHFSDVAARTDGVSSLGAGSTGRRNTGVKSLCRGLKLQGLRWSFVELTSHFVQIGLRVHRQVGALRKVLPQQAIGVLVRPALPRALRIAKNIRRFWSPA